MKIMKKVVFILISLFSVQTMFSQFTLENQNNGNTISDGEIIVFNQLGYPNGNMYVDIYNNTSSPINIHSQCIGLVNTDGSSFQYCVGNTCYNNVYVGQYCPANPFQIPANSKNGNFDGFLNANPGDGTNYPCDYTFKFFQTDASGNEIGTPITLTYRYQSSLSTEDFSTLQNFGIELSSTIIENELSLTAKNENLEITIFDLTGKLVTSKKLTTGNNTIDLTNISSGIYQVIFSNGNSKNLATKIVKK